MKVVEEVEVQEEAIHFETLISDWFETTGVNEILND